MAIENDTADKLITLDNLAVFQEEIDERKQDTLVSGTNIKTINNTSLLGSGNISIIGSTMCYSEGLDVQVSFVNSMETYGWDATKIYNNYTVTGNNLYLNSADEIGSIPSYDGSTLVSTETGKLFIFGDGGGLTSSTGEIATSSGITLTGELSGNGGSYGVLSDLIYIYIDNVLQNYTTGSTLLYAFSVTADGSITIDGAEWQY